MALGTVRLSEILKFKLSIWIPCYYANYRCVNFIFWTSLFVNKKILCKFLWENCHQHHNFSATTSPVVTVFTFHVMFYFPVWNRKNVFSRISLDRGLLVTVCVCCLATWRRIFGLRHVSPLALGRVSCLILKHSSGSYRPFYQKMWVCHVTSINS